MGDIGSCELIDGEIVRLSPAGGVHGFLEARLAHRLATFIEDTKAGWPMIGEKASISDTIRIGYAALTLPSGRMQSCRWVMNCLII
jgi:hypothetical protein